MTKHSTPLKDLIMGEDGSREVTMGFPKRLWVLFGNLSPRLGLGPAQPLGELSRHFRPPTKKKKKKPPYKSRPPNYKKESTQSPIDKDTLSWTKAPANIRRKKKKSQNSQTFFFL